MPAKPDVCPSCGVCPLALRPDGGCSVCGVPAWLEALSADLEAVAAESKHAREALARFIK